MRYLTWGMLAIVLALGLPNERARGVDVSVGAEVKIGRDLNIGFFYEQLTPYGQWVEVDNYGWAWQPSVIQVEADWRPYFNEGHWVYTDVGWYWESSYPWGWAAFHYGRWHHHDRYKWVWIPDVTWGPAWVTWRHSHSVYGWAPLPPGVRFEAGVLVGADLSLNLRADFFSFVPARSFLSVNLVTEALPRTQVTQVFQQTTIVNNSYTYNDNRVINNGIPVNQVATATSKEIKPVSIADAKTPSEKAEAGKISAFRPAIKDEKPKAPPAAAKTNKEETPTDTKKAPDTKAGEKAPDAKAGEKTPDAKAGERTPDAKAGEKAPDAKAGERTPDAKAGEKAPDAKRSERPPEAKPETRQPEVRQEPKAPDAKMDEKPQGGHPGKNQGKTAEEEEKERKEKGSRNR